MRRDQGRENPGRNQEDMIEGGGGGARVSLGMLEWARRSYAMPGMSGLVEMNGCGALVILARRKATAVYTVTWQESYIVVITFSVKELTNVTELKSKSLWL